MMMMMMMMSLQSQGSLEGTASADGLSSAVVACITLSALENCAVKRAGCR
jgi:hypothetical protein